MEDRQKVQDKLNQLNGSITNKTWIDIPGFTVLTEFAYGQTENTPKFNPNAGYPIKIFVNVLTGEVKLFGAYKFKAKQ